MKRLVLCLYFTGIASLGLFSQQNGQFSESLDWSEKQITWQGISKTLINCDNCFVEETNYLPTFTKSYPLSSVGKASAKVINPQFQALKSQFVNELIPANFEQESIEVEATIAIDRKKPFAQVSFIPLVKKNGQWFKITDFDLQISVSPLDFDENPPFKKTESTEESILNQGNFYQFLVQQDGIQKIDRSFLEALGITPGAVLMDNIRIYGNGGRMLPHNAGAERQDDLLENPIEVVDQNGNNQFDEGDFILFYGEGPGEWHLSGSADYFQHKTHLYANSTSYFLNYDIGPGIRIESIGSETNPNQTAHTYDLLAYHELEEHNILNSGRTWFGNQMTHGTGTQINFNLPNLIKSEPIRVDLKVAATSHNATNVIELKVNGNSTAEYSLSKVAQDLGSDGGKQQASTFQYTSNSEAINFEFNYDNFGGNGKAWVDYIVLNAKANLELNNAALTNGQMPFRNLATVGEGNITRFNLQNPVNNLRVWEISNLGSVQQVNLSNDGSTKYFALPTETLRTFIAFNGNEYFTPTAGGLIEKQNLHANEFPEYIIIGHPSLSAQINELADFHRDNGLSVKIAYIQEVYNEFSSGTPDITAIRDYVKMYYDRATNEEQMPKYLLLFGDCSYDYKNIEHLQENNTNLVPIYESAEPFVKASNYCTDDYFGYLDDNEGENLDIKEIKMDIAVGRFPVATPALAQSVVNKIKHYKSEASIGAWSNTLTFVADDGDGNLHLEDSEAHTSLVSNQFHNYNINKIYLDAFPQISGQSGESYPAVNTAILDNVFNGSFIINYAGHGKETGWAKENILDSRAISEMENIDKLPLFVTATCTFTRLDEPDSQSAGELLVTNPNGGAIAIVSTVRVVYAFSNKDINQTFLQNAFKKIDGKYPTLGEATRLAKNQVTTRPDNSRKFGLFGDPALTLNFPEHKVVTTQIVNESFGEVSDTIQALNQVTISGKIVDTNGNLVENFNGSLTPIIFDKAQTLTTLGNDLPAGYDAEDPSYNCTGEEKSCPVDFDLQQNVIFRGNASIENGAFSFSFVVPKDISYQFGKGKISYFAQDGLVTAADYDTTLVIGGISDAQITDNEGPEVEIYINDENFVFGGLTDENPLLIVKLEDENGINTVGTGIGHDLTAFMDEEDPIKDQRFILNNNYKSELDNFKKGKAELQLFDLEPGLHTIRVKAWDVYNNSGEGYTEFLVAESAELALQRILNYPNPFMDKTNFWVEHNRPGDVLKVRIQIFTISGRVVKTIQEELVSKGSRIDHLEWDGLDEFGNPIGRGVYVYQVTVTDSNQESISETQKLVLLK